MLFVGILIIFSINAKGLEVLDLLRILVICGLLLVLFYNAKGLEVLNLIQVLVAFVCIDYDGSRRKFISSVHVMHGSQGPNYEEWNQIEPRESCYACS